MNLYVLFAIALSAFSGVTDAPVARPGLASVVSSRAARADEQVTSAAERAVFPPRREAAARPLRTSAPRRADAPLAGASTPRAPATC